MGDVIRTVGKPKGGMSSDVKHDHIDLTNDAKGMAKQLEVVEAEYLFFAAYLQKGSEQEMWDIHGTITPTPNHIFYAITELGQQIPGVMLRNFLEAAKKLKRVILTTGAKQYGVPLGPVKVPMEETDPWIESPSRPPNVYYNQQNILKEKSPELQLGRGRDLPNRLSRFTANPNPNPNPPLPPPQASNLPRPSSQLAPTHNKSSASPQAPSRTPPPPSASTPPPTLELPFPLSRPFHSLLDSSPSSRLHAPSTP